MILVLGTRAGTVTFGQGIPVRVHAERSSDVKLEVDGRALPLPAPYGSWIDVEPGKHRISLFVDCEPIETARYVVHR